MSSRVGTLPETGLETVHRLQRYGRGVYVCGQYPQLAVRENSGVIRVEHLEHVQVIAALFHTDDVLVVREGELHVSTHAQFVSRGLFELFREPILYLEHDVFIYEMGHVRDDHSLGRASKFFVVKSVNITLLTSLIFFANR